MKFYTYASVYGNKIIYRGYDDEKGHFIDKVPFSPTLYIPSQKPTKYKNLNGQYVSPIQPGSLRESKEFLDRYKDVDGATIYGMERFLYQFLSEEYPGKIEYDMDKIKIWSLDIETSSENGFPQADKAEEEVLLITMKDFYTKQSWTFGCRPFTSQSEINHYVQCSDEEDLLLTFIDFWKVQEPEVITGWNVNLFDITYLCNRLSKICGENVRDSLSPWNFVTCEDIYVMGKKQQKYNIFGVTILDYLDIYKKFTFTNRESYRLDVIAEIELNERKLDHSQYDTFKDFYTNDWKNFVLYNIHDVNLVDKLEEKMKLISLVLLMAYDAKCLYIDTFAQVRYWDILTYNYLKERNIVPSPRIASSKSEQYAGAYVKEPVPGMYDYVVSFDLASLYPSIIRLLNISPETLQKEKIQVDVDKMVTKEQKIETNYSVAANGCLYDNSVTGFMPELVKKVYNERVVYKKRMLECMKEYETNPSKELEKEISHWKNFQMAKKISINSLYGALGNAYFRYYKLENAEAITLTGQVIIRWIERKLNEEINNLLNTKEKDYVIAIDTDSVYLNLGPIVCHIFGKSTEQLKSEKSTLQNRVVEVLNEFCEKHLTPFIAKSYDEFCDYINAHEKTLTMKREAIADRGIWTAKKRYILNVWDNEGVRYTKPKLKMMGIEAVRSSTPAPCRKYIKEALEIVMNGTEEELIQYISKQKEVYASLSPEDAGFPRGVSDVTKYSIGNSYTKGTPIATRAGILFNILVKRYNLENKYNLIQNGEKIKFIFLKTPNPIHENVIAFINKYPTEFNLTEYIDYDTMYDKGFVEPMKVILDTIHWSTEKTNTLDNFFL